jgi:hypothetical protein
MSGQAAGGDDAGRNTPGMNWRLVYAGIGYQRFYGEQPQIYSCTPRYWQCRLAGIGGTGMSEAAIA